MVTRNGYYRRFCCIWESATYATKQHFESLPLPVFFAELLGTFLRFMRMACYNAERTAAESPFLANPEHVERLTHHGHLIEFVGESSRFLKPNAADRTVKREMCKTETGALTEQ